MEVITGPTGRRRWPDDVKSRIVAESISSDRPVSEVARRNGLVPSQLFAWRRQAQDGKLILPDDDAAAFAPLLVEADPSLSSAPSGNSIQSGMIAIEIGDLIVRLAADTPAARIAEIVRALQVGP
jgi:transposase